MALKVLSLLAMVSTSQAVPYMVGVFGDMMVIQHDKPAVRGCGAVVGAVVHAHVTGPTTPEDTSSTADANGCFTIVFKSRPVGTSPEDKYTIAVSNEGSPQPFATARDVMFGIVILCSGQSNMVHPLSYDYNATAQIAASKLLPNLRLFQVGRNWSDTSGKNLELGCHDGLVPNLTPDCSLRNKWAPAATNSSNFSAVCYLTAQELLRDVYTPNTAMGLIESDWGGSNEATWQTRLSAQHCDIDPAPSVPCDSLLHESPPKENAWGCLFNGMIEPLTLTLNPVMALWYQGEANQNDPEARYNCMLQAMIREWRVAFNNSQLPFFLVQLAPYAEGKRCPPNNSNQTTCASFPPVRVAQADACQAVLESDHAPTGYCVTHDLGDIAGGIHPHNKTEVGRRMALAIRSQVFNQIVPGGAPSTVNSANISADGQLVVAFNNLNSITWGPTHNCSDCCAPINRVVEVCHQENAICAVPNSTWEGFPAVVVNGRLHASLPPSSVAPSVRYAWRNFPECVLFSETNLPVGPFELVPKLTS